MEPVSGPHARCARCGQPRMHHRAESAAACRDLLVQALAGVAESAAAMRDHVGQHLGCGLCDAVRLLARGEDEIQRMALETR